MKKRHPHNRRIDGLILAAIILGSSAGCLGADQPARISQQPSGLPESALIAIRDGFDARVARLFEEQKAVAPTDTGSSGFNSPQRYAYPRIEYATANLWLGQNIDAANTALVEYGDYFLRNPGQILFRDNFHWHSEMALRLIEFFGRDGTRTRGLIKPETEDKILEAVWLYSKRRQQDQKPGDTKAEADTEASNTWHIYESENHHSQSFCTLWHFAKLARERPAFRERIYDDGLNAAAHFEKWNTYLKLYFLERARKGIFIEAMSQDYNEKSAKGVFNIYDFSPDKELRRRAGLYLDLYFTYWGEEQLDGISGGGKSRLYSDVAPSTSDLGYLFFGIGERPRFRSTLLSAMTSAYRPPLVVVDIACDGKGRGRYEVVQRTMGLAVKGHNEPPVYRMRTDFGGIVRYSYCTPDFIIGTAMFEAKAAEEWTLISSQNRSHGVIFASSPLAGILPQYEKTKNNRAYNSVWSVQKMGTMISQKLKFSRETGRVRIWFAAEGLSAPVEVENWIFAESSGAYAAVRVVRGGHHWEEPASSTNSRSRAKGKWLYCDDEYSPVILEVDQKSNYPSQAAFRAKVLGNPLSLAGEVLNYTGIYGDTFTFFADASKAPAINGVRVDYAPARVYDSPFLQAEWNSGVVRIQKGARSLVLDFNSR